MGLSQVSEGGGLCGDDLAAKVVCLSEASRHADEKVALV
jgi:hypothetical protein